MEKIMNFRNDLSRYSDYNKELIKKTLSIFIPTIIVSLISIYSTLYKMEQGFFILKMTTVTTCLSSFIFILLYSARSKKMYESLEISFVDDVLSYSVNNKNITLNVKDIEKITEHTFPT